MKAAAAVEGVVEDAVGARCAVVSSAPSLQRKGRRDGRCDLRVGAEEALRKERSTQLDVVVAG